jgi:SAM-dependent methyltransferase
MQVFFAGSDRQQVGKQLKGPSPLMKNDTKAPAEKPLSGAGLDPFRVAWGEQPSPWLLNFVCAISGFAGRSPGKGFTFCEIGGGGGNDLLFLAAANPESRFHGVAVDGASFASARDFQSHAEVGNCIFHESRLDALGSLQIPALDFLALTGVLSREENAANRCVLSFAAQHLKPGGVVLCSYRTPHAWAFWEPVIHFLRAAADAPGDRAENIQAGLGELHRLRESGAALFQVSPLVGAIVDSIGGFVPGHFDSAFLQTPCRTLYFDEVCRDMEGIGLGYAGGLPLATNYPRIGLPDGLRDRFSGLPGLRLRETWKDLVRMPFFRRDVFTSAVRDDRAELPAETVLGSFLRREQFCFAFDMPGAASVRLDGPLFQLLADLLAENALPLPAILSSQSLKQFPAPEILSSLAWMTAMEQIRPFASAVRDDDGADPFRLSRFNTAALNQQLARRKADAVLASRTLGNGVTLHAREALALLALSEAGPQDAEAWAGRWLMNHSLSGRDDPEEPTLGRVIEQTRANPRALSVLGLSEKNGPN